MNLGQILVAASLLALGETGIRAQQAIENEPGAQRSGKTKMLEAGAELLCYAPDTRDALIGFLRGRRFLIEE